MVVVLEAGLCAVFDAGGGEGLGGWLAVEGVQGGGWRVPEGVRLIVSHVLVENWCLRNWDLLSTLTSRGVITGSDANIVLRVRM